MRSIPPKKLCEIAAAAAYESGRPWRVKELRAQVLKVYRTVESRAARSGFSGEPDSEQVHRLTYEQAKKAGKVIDPLQPGQKIPTPEQIETALEAFTIEQWITLIDGLDQTSTEVLLSHIRQGASELKRRFGARKVERIEGRANMRDTDLWLRDNRSTLVPISDVYWADVWPELAREANRRGKGHQVKGRSVVEELGSNSSIARRLTKRDEQTGREMKVNDREVKRWREQMERLPFEQYATDVGADDDEKRAAAFIDYYTMIRKKYQRKN